MPSGATSADARYVWVQDPELVYSPALVLNEKSGGKLQVQLLMRNDRIVEVDGATASSLHPSCLLGVSDLLELGELDMPALLHNIRTRYSADQIYTSVGPPILVSVNPYRPLPGAYSAEVAASYRSGAAVAEPHPYAIAQRALSAICLAKHRATRTRASHVGSDGDCVPDQSIIISGESGAGKTEATKIILAYLAGTVEGSRSQSDDEQPPSSRRRHARIAVETQLTQSNPLLESFGNAKTIRNDNSSRFGKFSKVLINRSTRRIVGARISSYLLEKSRIVTQQADERNYHIFYQLCAGAHLLEESIREELQLLTPSKYNYLRTSTVVHGRDDAQDFAQIIQCLRDLDFDYATQANVWRFLAGLLHLGNVEFDAAANTNGVLCIKNSKISHLEISSRLLGLDIDSLSDLLKFSSIKDVREGQTIKTVRTTEAAYVSRDSLSKTLYDRLFQWLIQRVNGALAGFFFSNSRTGDSSHAEDAECLGASVGAIGLLDIFGFEVFETNSFEQLCINFANEQLQQHFNKHVFSEEQSLYQSEGIEWRHIVFEDNASILDALSNPKVGGVLPALDSECLMPQGSDKTFLGKMVSLAATNPIILKSRLITRPTLFGVSHYAGEVFYEAQGMVDKNRDRVQSDVYDCVKGSLNPLVYEAMVSLHPASSQMNHLNAQGPGNLAKATVSYAFREQLKDLMKVLGVTSASYLRCIKPNGRKAPKLFASADIMRQLHCAGMLESIRIRKAGYALRYDFGHFVKLYRVLLPPTKQLSLIAATKLICERLVEEYNKLRTKKGNEEESQLLTKPYAKRKLSPVPAIKPPLTTVEGPLWQIGHTKVFMKELLHPIAERLVITRVNAVTLIAAHMRMHFAYKRYVEFRKAIQTLLEAATTRLQRCKFVAHVKLRAANGTIIQRAFRAYVDWARVVEERAVLRKFVTCIENAWLAYDLREQRYREKLAAEQQRVLATQSPLRLSRCRSHACTKAFSLESPHIDLTSSTCRRSSTAVSADTSPHTGQHPKRCSTRRELDAQASSQCRQRENMKLVEQLQQELDASESNRVIVAETLGRLLREEEAKRIAAERALKDEKAQRIAAERSLIELTTSNEHLATVADSQRRKNTKLRDTLAHQECLIAKMKKAGRDREKAEQEISALKDQLEHAEKTMETLRTTVDELSDDLSLYQMAKIQIATKEAGVDSLKDLCYNALTSGSAEDRLTLALAIGLDEATIKPSQVDRGFSPPSRLNRYRANVSSGALHSSQITSPSYCRRLM